MAFTTSAKWTSDRAAGCYFVYQFVIANVLQASSDVCVHVQQRQVAAADTGMHSRLRYMHMGENGDWQTGGCGVSVRVNVGCCWRDGFRCGEWIPCIDAPAASQPASQSVSQSINQSIKQCYALTRRSYSWVSTRCSSCRSVVWQVCSPELGSTPITCGPKTRHTHTYIMFWAAACDSTS